VVELEGCISVLGRNDLSRAEKKTRWLAGREQIGMLCGTLGGYLDVLGCAADLIAL